MKEKTYLNISAALFSLIALLHLFRLIFAWEPTIDLWMAPMWVSVLALIIGALLAYQGFKFGKK